MVSTSTEDIIAPGAISRGVPPAFAGSIAVCLPMKRGMMKSHRVLGVLGTSQSRRQKTATGVEYLEAWGSGAWG